MAGLLKSRRIGALVAGVGAAALVGYGGVAASGATLRAATPVTVTVSTKASGQVGSGFAGFSYEKDRVGAGMFDAHDTSLVNLFRLLGPSVLRIGGNLVDIVNWNSKGAGGSATEVAPADVTKLAGFAQATGWKVLYGINLKTNTAAKAASEAAFASKALGSSLLAFEIGNEPNFYRTEATYETSYNAYVNAIRAKVPGAVFDGPGQGDSTSWVGTFAPHEKNNGLQILSTHLYIGNKTTATVAGMLASNSSGRLPNAETAMDNARSANGIPQWRMTEANSYFHGGADGVSNVQAAALWALDFMHGIASHHGVGINFHGGTSTQFPLAYSPIVYNGLTPTGVQAVYYAELLWSLAGTGSLHAATVSGASAVTAWGIGTSVIVNNESSATLTARVRLAGPATKANGYPLTAPSLSSKAITLAGSNVTASAAFHPAPQTLTISGSAMTVTVPAGSAVLITTS
jgi:hypothetical protein